MAMTCGFVTWVALQDDIQVWQVMAASALVLVALAIALFNRRLEKKFKKPSTKKPNAAKSTDN